MIRAALPALVPLAEPLAALALAAALRLAAGA
jgi:hypothetical protein